MERVQKRRRPQAVFWGKLDWHPAVKAWREFGLGVTEPESLEVLRDHKRSGTYRLVGAGSGGESIIARRAPAALAAVARTWHEHIVPRLPGATPRYFGYRREGVRSAWLFFEDGG